MLSNTPSPRGRADCLRFAHPAEADRRLEVRWHSDSTPCGRVHMRRCVDHGVILAKWFARHALFLRNFERIIFGHQLQQRHQSCKSDIRRNNGDMTLHLNFGCFLWGFLAESPSDNQIVMTLEKWNPVTFAGPCATAFNQKYIQKHGLGCTPELVMKFKICSYFCSSVF